MNKEYFGTIVPFIEHLGIEAKELEDGGIEVTLELKPEHCNSIGVSHGGVMMTMLDFAMAMAAKLKTNHIGAAITIDMSVSFMKGANKKITVIGKTLRSGKSIQFCEAYGYDISGELVAKAMGTFKLISLRN
ncbi:MAG: PaaI family thioesterase [Betaproteobacteria bacterium]|jgi:uncharacterized protein (TIGR00369 family)